MSEGLDIEKFMQIMRATAAEVTVAVLVVVVVVVVAAATIIIMCASITLSINRTHAGRAPNYTINIRSDNLVINTLVKTEQVIITAFTCHRKQGRASITTPAAAARSVWMALYTRGFMGPGAVVALNA